MGGRWRHSRGNALQPNSFNRGAKKIRGGVLRPQTTLRQRHTVEGNDNLLITEEAAGRLDELDTADAII
jgi:hypothetical protein